MYSDPYDAVDKKLNTRAATGGDSPWLKLEFARVQKLYKVVIYFKFYTDWFKQNATCVSDEDAWKTCVDKSNNIDVSVYKDGELRKSCGTLQLTYGLEQSDQIYTLVCNTGGNELLLSKAFGDIKIWEIQVIGKGEYDDIIRYDKLILKGELEHAEVSNHDQNPIHTRNQGIKESRNQNVKYFIVQLQ